MYDRFGIKYILTDSERLEQFELKAARILTGLTSCASLLSIYKETGWEKLSVRREKRKLSLLYDIVSGQSPDYLQDVLPITVGQTNNYNLRNSRNFTIPSPGRFHNALRKVSQFPQKGFKIPSGRFHNYHRKVSLVFQRCSKYHYALEQSTNRLEIFSLTINV
jgi:hypothetical protein